MITPISSITDSPFRAAPVGPANSAPIESTDTVSDIVRNRVSQTLADRLRPLDLRSGPVGTFQTGRDRDVSLSDNRLFAVRLGQDTVFTRSLSLGIDSLGNVVDSLSGARVLGTDGNKEPSNPRAIELTDDQRRLDASPTIGLSVSGTLSGDIPVGQTLERTVTTFDSEGNEGEVTLRFERTGDDRFQVTSTDPISGNLLVDDTLQVLPNGVLELEREAETEAEFGDSEAVLADESGDGEPTAIEDVEYDELNVLGSETNVEIEQQGGRSGSELVDLTLDTEGNLVGIYEDGRRQIIDRVAVADVDSPQDMTAIGNTLLAPAEGTTPEFSGDDPVEPIVGRLETPTGFRTTPLIEQLLADGTFLARRNALFRSQEDLLGDVVDFMA
jgi:flagellar hook-basal body protein